MKKQPARLSSIVMNREYHIWYSPHLNRNMELLVFGHAGAPVLLFPTRTARFYDYENWRIVSSLTDKIEQGYLQLYCVDSIDSESFYCKWSHPSQRILRHMQYEDYILKEVLPLINLKNSNQYIISAGCSLGAYHAVNIALRHPYAFCKIVGLSGRYDLTVGTNYFNDLFDGYRDENVYLNMPTQYLPGLQVQQLLESIRKLDIILASGKEDPFLNNNKHLHNILHNKQIPNRLDVWEGEAHCSKYWRQMMSCYL